MYIRYHTESKFEIVQLWFFSVRIFLIQILNYVEVLANLA